MSAVASTRIDRVHVHRNGALVRRAGEARPGPVEVNDLPLLFVQDALRVIPSRGAVRRVEEGCRLIRIGLQGDEAARELAEVTLEAEALADRLRSLQAVIQLLHGVTPAEASGEGPPPIPDVKAWLALQDFAEDRVEALVAEHEDLLEQLRELKRRHGALKRAVRGELNPPRFHRSVRFELEAASSDDDAPIPFAVEYFVPAARWVPTYRVGIEGGQAELRMSALLAQASGEDWDGAQLFFSTADLARSTSLPELRSWRIAREQQPAPLAYRPLPPDLPTLFAGYDDARHRAGPPPTPALPERAARRASVEEERAADDEADGFAADLSTGGRQAMYASFEDEATGEYALSEMLPLDVDSDTTGGFEQRKRALARRDEDGAARPAGVVAAAMIEAPAAILADDRDDDESLSRLTTAPLPAAPSPAAFAAAPPAAARAASLGGGLTRSRAGLPEVPPSGALPAAPRPKLRYAYYRLAGPDERRRGELLPLDPIEHLGSLLDDHDVDDLAALRRAITALERAAERLHQSPLPPGCSAIDAGSYPHVFEAPARHQVPTDGEWHRVFVEREEAPARIELKAVPRRSEDVYRILSFRPSRDVPRPRGPLLVHVDGVFRAETVLDPGEGQEGLELSLGTEPAVRVVGRTTHVHQEEKGLVSQTSRIDHEVVTELKSGLSHDVDVVLFDRLPSPAPNQKELDVSLLPTGLDLDRTDRGPDGRRLPGGVQIRARVPARGKASVKLAYRVTLPAKAELLGGNRRE